MDARMNTARQKTDTRIELVANFSLIDSIVLMTFLVKCQNSPQFFYKHFHRPSFNIRINILLILICLFSMSVLFIKVQSSTFYVKCQFITVRFMPSCRIIVWHLYLVPKLPCIHFWLLLFEKIQSQMFVF